MKQHIEEFLHNFRAAAPRYAKYERYYRGDHDLAFATEKFANTFGSLFREFALNLCPVICDAVRDKLLIREIAADKNDDGRSSGITSAAAEIWGRNRMTIRSAEVHREALLNGDAYVIVWPDADGKASIHPNRAAFCSAVYDEEHPGRILRAAKYWRTRDGHTRLNVFYPDRIERFVTAKTGEALLPSVDELVPFVQASGGKRSGTLANPFGVVPVFHFANSADIGSFGRSELEPALPVQDGMNKSVLDMLVAMEFSAYRQRWAAGIEIQYDNDGNPIAPFKAGIDHLWITENPNARFGDFHTVDLDQFIKVKDSFRVDMASVTGTPMYYLMPHTRGFPSGEALSRAEARFTSKVRSRQTSFGHTWAEVMEFALKIQNKPNVSLRVHWEKD